MMFEVITDKMERDDGAPVEVYGVQALCGGKVLCRAPALSTDGVRVERFAALVSDYDLSPLHLYDVLEDFLCALC